MNHVSMSGRLVADPVLCEGPCGQRYALFKIVLYDERNRYEPDRVIDCSLWGDAGVKLAYDGRAGQFVETCGRYETIREERPDGVVHYPFIRCRWVDIIPAHLAGYLPWNR